MNAFVSLAHQMMMPCATVFGDALLYLCAGHCCHHTSPTPHLQSSYLFPYPNAFLIYQTKLQLDHVVTVVNPDRVSYVGRICPYTAFLEQESRRPTVRVLATHDP